MIEKKNSQRVRLDKGTEFKRAVQEICQKEGIDAYTTESQTKSTFAESNFRSLKNIN